MAVTNDMEKVISVKRSFLFYAFNLMGVAIFITLSLLRTSEIKYVFLLLALVEFSITAMIFLKKNNYFILDGDILIINKSIFSSKTFDINNISQIRVTPSPFFRSYIKFENKDKVTFNSLKLNEKELNSLFKVIELKTAHKSTHDK